MEKNKEAAKRKNLEVAIPPSSIFDYKEGQDNIIIMFYIRNTLIKSGTVQKILFSLVNNVNISVEDVFMVACKIGRLYCHLVNNIYVYE
jgi:hypothetical protein